MRRMLAELDDPARLVAAARALRALGYVRVEAYTPYPVPGLEEALGLARSTIPRWALAAGALGGLGAFGLQYLLNGVLYPLNVGGRPLFSAPAFVPIAFETTVLSAALATFAALLVKCGLPRPWHPLFEVPGFERASVDRFFLVIHGADARFDPALAARHLGDLGATRVRLIEVEE